MRKSRLFILFILLYSGLLFIIPFFDELSIIHPLNGSLIIIFHITILFCLFFFGLYFQMQEKAFSAKEITFIAIYSAFTSIARIPFLALPSIQPCTFLIFCAGIVFGSLIGFMIGMNTVILSNFIAGHGPWTLYQIIGWGLVGIVGGFIGTLLHSHDQKYESTSTRIILSIVSFFLGIVFGLIMNVWSWLILEPPLTLAKFTLLYLSSLPFDFLHGISNVIFLWVFGPQTLHILTRFKNRLFTQILTISNNYEDVP